jgi:Putative Ig domain
MNEGWRFGLFVSVICLLASLTQSGCANVANSASQRGTPPRSGANSAPSILTQPASQTVNAGQTATFLVTASGTAPLSYQWEKNGVAISGAASASYTTQPETTGAEFAVVVSNSVGSVTSSIATLTVNTVSGAITVNPNNLTLAVGHTSAFSANISGTSNTAMTWTVSGSGCISGGCGTISASGLYLAPMSVPYPPLVIVRATSAVDPSKSASASVTIVAAVAVLLSLSPANASVVTSGTQLFRASVTGTSNTAVTWSVTGMGCNGSACGSLSSSGLTAVYSAPPVAPQPAKVTVTATSAAGQGISASAQVAFALQITSGGSSNGVVGVPFQTTNVGSGGVAPYNWSAIGALPSGMTLNASSGTIGGTPTQTGTSTFTIKLTDSTGQTAQKLCAITISSTLQPVAISATTLAPPTVGQAYSAGLQAVGGVPPYSWTVVSGQLPNGITLVATTGQLTGIPTPNGQFNFTAQVTDSTLPTGQTATQAFTLTVNIATSTSLSVTSEIIPPATQGAAYSSTNGTAVGGSVLAISGGTAPYTCSVASGSIPPGMRIGEVTPNYTPAGLCVISGTPTATGDYTWTEKVTDAQSATASATVNFVVVSSSLPVLSAPFVASVSPTSETITWTSNVAATSSVCYQGAGVATCTPVTDPGGVTSHSVTLTNLLPGAGYQFWPVSKGIVGSVGVDYLAATDPTTTSAGCCNDGFTATTYLLTGGVDFSMQPSGPHNVIQGFPLYAGFYANEISGAGNITSWKVQVTGIPSFTKVHWPDQQDNGFGQGGVATTTTTDDTLIFGIVEATKFEILSNVGGTTPVGNYTLTVTATAQPGNVVHSYTWAYNVAVASFPSGTPSSYPAIPLLSTWASNMIFPWPLGSGGPTNNWYLGNQFSGTPAYPNCDQCIHYYDGQWVYYQIGLYTNNPTYWNVAANNAQALYHAKVNLGSPAGNGVQGYWVFPHGLYYDCTHNGNSVSCMDLNAIATNSANANLVGPDYTSCQLQREAAYMLGAKRLNYDAGGSSTVPQVKQMASQVLGLVDQIVNGYNDYQAEESFMDGLIAQALIEYYMDPNTGNGDVRVPPAVKALADHLWTNNFIPWAGTNGNFLYQVQQYNSGIMNQQTSFASGDLQALNMLIVPMYGWLYQKTGLTQYQLEGDTIWASGVNDPTGGGIGYSGKNFSQQYRWSMDYVKWRSGP